MKPLKVALCDDSAVDRAYLFYMCKRIKEQENIQIKLKEYGTGDSLLFDFESPATMNSVDIVLLDISMPGKNGIEVAKELRELGYQGSIIFVTKSKNLWKAAFDVKALNYLVKEEDDMENRFMEVFIAAKDEAMKRRGKTLLFSSIGETRQIEERSISHFLVKDHLMRVYYDNDKTFEFTSSLSKIEELLYGNDNFMRVNRNSVISISHIEKVNKKSVNMLNGEEVPVSARKMKGLREAVLLSMFKD